MFSLLSALAFSASPTSVVESDGTVCVSMHLEASEASVRSVLSDTAGGLKELSDDVLSVETRPRGNCEEVERQSRGVWRPFSWISLRCPTERGWREDLLSSDDFSAFETEWTVSGDASGTLVTYRVRTELTAPVPQTIVRDGIVRSATASVVNLAKKALHLDQR